MSAGQVDIRKMKHDDKYRIRFYRIAPDQLETILSALEAARKEMGTIYDSVALDVICLSFLETKCGMEPPQYKKASSPISQKQKNPAKQFNTLES